MSGLSTSSYEPVLRFIDWVSSRRCESDPRDVPEGGDCGGGWVWSPAIRHRPAPGQARSGSL